MLGDRPAEPHALTRSANPAGPTSRRPITIPTRPIYIDKRAKTDLGNPELARLSAHERDPAGTGRELESRPSTRGPLGAQSTSTAFTEYRGVAAPAGNRLYVGIDAGRRHHVVAAIVQERMENGSWQRAVLN